MVVLQTRYAPYIAPAVEGQIADTADSEVGTRLCETVAGIPFGKAVSWGAGPKSCVLGGATKFVGLSVRDITLVLAPVDPLSTTPNPLDAYGRYTNVSVMSRGHMWVKPQALVVPGDDAYYDGTSGVLGNSATGMAASGWVRFSRQPVAGETLQLGTPNATLTFVASGATGDQVNIGATMGDTIAAAAAVLDGSATAGFSTLTFRADPASVTGAPSGADTIYIQNNAVGTGGNAIPITSGPAGMTKSGAVLSGGTASAVAITAGKWITGAIGGQLAIVSLGIQQ
jgi:hypothetical protein